MCMGRHDYTTPSEPTAAWIAQVEAPCKAGVWFEHSAHMVPWEEPGKTLVSLLETVQPLATAGGCTASMEAVADGSDREGRGGEPSPARMQSLVAAVAHCRGLLRIDFVARGVRNRHLDNVTRASSATSTGQALV